MDPPTATSDPPPLGYELGRAWRRLHPATIAVEAIDVLRELLLPLAAVVAFRVMGRPVDALELVFFAVAALRVVVAVAQYATVRYAVDPTALHIRSGLLLRQRRTIPLRRIQNINLRRSPVHRALGVAELQIETASAAKAEGRLAVLRADHAESLRQELLRLAAAAPAVPPPSAETVYRASMGMLLLAGATHNRVGAVVAALLGTGFYIVDLIADEQSVAQWLRARATEQALPGAPLVAAILAAFIVVGWLASMAQSLVMQHDFRVESRDGRLTRRFGLLTRVENVVTPRRIQMLRLRQGWLHRLLGLAVVRMHTAGSFGEQDSGGSSELFPILRRRDAAGLCLRALPEAALDGALSPVSRRAIRRAFLRFAAALLGGVAAAAWRWDLRLAALAAPALLLAWWAAWLRFRGLGWRLDDRALLARRGLLGRTTVVVPRDRIQACTVRQSPLDRRLGLARLSVLTAAAGLGNAWTIPDLPLDVALAAQDALAAQRSRAP